MKVIVIGSGFGGLGVANRLAAKGHQVKIFDNRDRIGGRAYQYQVNGFKFDGGPTVITAPYMFDEIFEAAGKKREDYIQLVPLDPFYRIFDHDGKYFDYRLNIEDTLNEIERWNPADREGYLKFDNQTRAIFDRFHPFTDHPFLSVQDMLKIFPDVIRLKAFLGYYGFSSLYIKNQFLRQVFSFHPLLIGGNPFDTPSIFSLIVQFERRWGVHYAIGGTGAIVDALGRLFVEQGGQVHLNSTVKEILVEGRKAIGIRLEDGSVHKADVVISNGDVANTYRHLIPAEYRRKYTNARIDRMKYSMSLFVIYFGVKRQYRNDGLLQHHNIILNDRYKGLLNDIFNRNVLPDAASR